MNTKCDRCGEENPADIHTCTPKRPPNCGTGYCSCVECVMEPAPVPMAHIVGEIDHTGKVWAPAAQPALCTWTKSNDPHMPDTFNATCGVVWTFTDGGPAENDVRFCPGCGGKVVKGKP